MQYVHILYPLFLNTNSGNILLHIRYLDDMHMNIKNNTDVINNIHFINYEIKSEKKVYKLYYRYVYNVGFSARKKHHNYHPNFKKMRCKNFICSKLGNKNMIRS